MAIIKVGCTACRSKEALLDFRFVPVERQLEASGKDWKALISAEEEAWHKLSALQYEREKEFASLEAKRAEVETARQKWVRLRAELHRELFGEPDPELPF
jgi:hypothetical protein